jgi:hypothetical protein
MIKNEWIIKHFLKNKAIRAIIHFPDHRIRLYWILPKDGLITINDKTYSCDANRDYFSLLKGIPTFTYQVDKIEPLRFDDIKASAYSAAEYNTAINNKVIRDIFSANDKKTDLVTAVIVGMVAVVLIVGVAGFFLYKEIESIKIAMAELREVLRAVTGQ